MSEKYSGTKFETIFKEKIILYNEKINELAGWCKKFSELGLAPFVEGNYAGNLSFRTDNGFIITAAGCNLGNTDKEDFVEVIEVKESEVIVRGIKNPSSETRMHNEIYKNRPEINAIFHGHDEAVLKNSKDLPITEKEQPYGSLELVQEVINVLNDNNYVIIRNHGIISLGKTMEEAGTLAIEKHNLSLS